MKSVPPTDSAQALQRVRVGMTGLAMVLVVIGLASVIFSSANRDEPVSAIGASNLAVVANMTDSNVVVEQAKDAPVADLGVAPTTGTTEAVNAAEIARREEEARRQAEAARKQ
jgi:hypothetical protein